MRKILATLAALAAVLVLVVGAMGAIRRIENFRTLEADFSSRSPGLVVASVRDSDLRPGDRVLLVNNREVATVSDFVDAVSGTAAAEAVVLRQGEVVRVELQPLGIDIDWPFLATAAIAIAYLAVGGFALARRRQPPGLLFFLWCLLSASLFLLSPGREFDLLDKVSYGLDEIARIFLPAVTLHLFLVFPTPLGVVERKRYRVALVYAPAMALAVLQADLMLAAGRWFSQGDLAGALLRLDRWELVHMVVAGLGAAAILGFRALTETSWEPRRQLLWIAVGIGAGYLPFALLYVLPTFFGRPIPEWRAFVAVALLGFIPVAFGYAYLRYRLADIGILIRSGVSTAVTLFVGVIGFSLVNLVLRDAMAEASELPRNLVSFTAGLAIAGLMVPTRRTIRDSLERIQYGNRAGIRRELAEFASRLSEEESRDLANELLSRIAHDLDLAPAELFLVEGKKLQAVGDWTAERLDVADFHEIWGLAQVELAPLGLAQEIVPAESDLFARGFRNLFPLVVRDEPVGLFACGHHSDDIPLNSDDVDLLRTVFDQAALAIDNARLFHTVEEQLEEVSRMQEFTHSILESSPGGIAVLDREGRIRSANRSLAAIFTRTPRELEGMRLTDLLDIDEVRPGMTFEAQVPRADGSTAYLQLSTAELADRSAREPLTVLLVQDVTERVEMEHALQEKERLASLGMLAAGVAHEVNTPITGISSYAQMLLEETDPSDPTYPLLKKVEQQTFRASRIVNNLLSLSRGSSGEVARIDLGQVLRDCADLLKERRIAADVELELHVDDQELWVSGSEGELSQVFTNLMVNAIDAMADGGGVMTIRAEIEDDRIRAMVVDTGPGIPREIQPRIFQPFFSTKTDSGGTGLGLSISYNIVERHGGEIRFDTRSGGTCFIVDLPRAEQGDDQ